MSQTNTIVLMTRTRLDTLVEKQAVTAGESIDNQRALMDVIFTVSEPPVETKPLLNALYRGGRPADSAEVSAASLHGACVHKANNEEYDESLLTPKRVEFLESVNLARTQADKDEELDTVCKTVILLVLIASLAKCIVRWKNSGNM